MWAGVKMEMTKNRVKYLLKCERDELAARFALDAVKVEIKVHKEFLNNGGSKYPAKYHRRAVKVNKFILKALKKQLPAPFYFCPPNTYGYIGICQNCRNYSAPPYCNKCGQKLRGVRNG